MIWYTRWMEDLDKQVLWFYRCEGGFDSGLAFSRAVNYCWPVERQHVPDFLFFYEDGAPSQSRRHAFNIADGLLVCSPALHSVLAAHDLGSSRLYEVPIYADEERTATDLPSHYLLHVTEGKDGTLVPQSSEFVMQIKPPHAEKASPDAPWLATCSRDVLAVRGSALGGADLWHDPRLRGRLFVSDRLKTAIEAAGIGPEELEFHEARIVAG